MRLPVTKKLHIALRLVVSFSDLDIGNDRKELKISLRIDYSYSRSLEMDIGMDFINVESQEDVF